ncbi:uncharacterized protein [Haliotis asinina]|uniref:uncharacterized protein n=1 Tax=Haliotis asinina TaxID=109174 RepID=UPI003531F2A0
MGDEAKIAEMTPVSHSFLHSPRLDKSGGGIAILFRKSLTIHRSDSRNSYKSFESMNVVITSGQATLNLVCIYPPPPSAKNKLKNNDFLQELPTLFATNSKNYTVILGDFNVHFNAHEKPEVKKYTQLLNTYSLTQHVSVATHKSGNILDWIITCSNYSIIKEVEVIDCQMSDHFNVFFTIDVVKPINKHSILMCHNISQIQPDSFRQDLVNSNLLTDPPPDVDDHVELFHDTLTSLIDKHAPAVEKKVILHPHAPWYDVSIRRSKTQRRRAERLWRKTRLEIHRQIYQQCRNATTSLIISAKRKYCLHSIENSMGKPASLYRLINTLLGKEGDGDRLPPGQSHKELADSFNSFFISKIDTIRKGLLVKDVDRCFSEPHFTGDPLMQFALFSPKDIESIIRSSKPTTCDSDPIPTKLLFQYLELRLPSITKIVDSKAVLVGTKQQLNKVKTDFLKVVDADIKFSDVVKDFGVYIDSSLTLDSHVNHLSRICYFHLKSIGNIRQYLTTAATEALVRALVTSRLDYCNSILSGLSSTLLEKLQKIQNTSARIISKTKRSRTTPVLKDLHWLPVKARIDFKILCLTYKCLHGLAPSYLNCYIRMSPHATCAQTLKIYWSSHPTN